MGGDCQPDDNDGGSSESSDSGSGFLSDMAEDACTEQCDIWDPQDCIEGTKCTAVACEVGASEWSHHLWREIQGDGQPGDPCLDLGTKPLSGLDDCEPGAMCIVNDADSGSGICYPFGTGPADTPGCVDGWV